jgi:hypothetical protein
MNLSILADSWLREARFERRIPRDRDSLAERGEFELPVPIVKHSDDSNMLSFATSRRTAKRYRLRGRSDHISRPGVLSSRAIPRIVWRRELRHFYCSLVVQKSVPAVRFTGSSPKRR